MKTLTLLLTVLATALLLVGPASAQVPAGTTQITFNNFCDGATITVNGDFIGGTHNLYDCSNTTFLGGAVMKDSFIAPKALATNRANLSDNTGVVYLGNCPLNLYLDFTNNGWAYYSSCDLSSPQTLLNKGTFTIVCSPCAQNTPVARGTGAVSSLQARSNDLSDQAGFVSDAFPKGPYGMYYNGYCDGTQMTTKGHNAGGYHDFSGCGIQNVAQAGNDAVIPADVEGNAGNGVYLTDDEFVLFGEDALLNWYYNFSTTTWVVYKIFDNTGMYFDNAGTFTMTQGAPPLAQRLGLPTAATK